jgi:hypothetical protein
MGMVMVFRARAAVAAAMVATESRGCALPD